MARVELDIRRNADGLQVTMPPAGNRGLKVLGYGFAIPYLVLMIVGSVVVAVIAPPELRREAILGAVWVNLLFFIVHILAVAGVWLAFYNSRGTETLEIGPSGIAVKRAGAGITVPFRLRRGSGEGVHVLDTSLSPGKWPHPRLEIRVDGTAVRFGAGLTAEEAARVRAVANEVLRETGATGE